MAIPQRTVKLVVIGAAGVGKTSIRGQYISQRFSTGYRATIGADFITKVVQVDEREGSGETERATLQIWDTAGQERFSSLSSAFFRGADAAVLVFDVNAPETLRALVKWWEEFKVHAPLEDDELGSFCCVVVGNKVDL
ncbi:P-loop containing nucleoside triphosphate hydrolase protein, partial [Lentinula lateritia]